MGVYIAGEKRFLARGASQYNTVDHDRTRSVGSVEVTAAIDLQAFLARLRVESNQIVIARGRVDLVAPNENAALPLAPVVIVHVPRAKVNGVDTARGPRLSLNRRTAKHPS